MKVEGTFHTICITCKDEQIAEFPEAEAFFRTHLEKGHKVKSANLGNQATT